MKKQAAKKKRISLMPKMLTCFECGEDFNPQKDGRGNSCCDSCFEGHPEPADQLEEEGA